MAKLMTFPVEVLSALRELGEAERAWDTAQSESEPAGLDELRRRSFAINRMSFWYALGSARSRLEALVGGHPLMSMRLARPPRQYGTPSVAFNADGTRLRA